MNNFQILVWCILLRLNCINIGVIYQFFRTTMSNLHNDLGEWTVAGNYIFVRGGKYNYKINS